MRTLLLKRVKQAEQFIGADASPLPLKADFVVLTKDAAQITMRKEDRSTPPRAGDGRFFSKMQLGKIDAELCSRLAISLCPRAIYPAFPGTYRTRVEFR